MSYNGLAQTQAPTLPAMSIITENAQNVISWTSQYDGVKSIAIQRSADSVRNFVTIGIINSPKKGFNTYTDERPLPGKNQYRVCVNFAGDVEWFSNVYKVELDSATIARSLEQAIKSGTTNSKSYSNTNGSSPVPKEEFYYTPSTKIYTNPYTGHIIIALVDAKSKRYSIRFLDPKKKEVLRISRVMKNYLILDKNNFNSRGTYQFQLYEGTSIAETGYITIY